MTDSKMQPGLTGETVWDVERKVCTQRGDWWIFSTPSMVQLAERAAIEMIAPYLCEGQVTVGTHVDIRHMAPSFEGMKVRAVPKLTEVDGARLEFTIEVFDDQEKVGEARHQRYILDLDRYVRRLEKKRAVVAAN
jgi:predicted thioesterase